MIPIHFHLDLAKAFDSLNHDILLDKLSYYGVNGTVKTLLKSYLSDRKQYVKIDEVKSSIQTIKTGVPQGSIVGPLIFLLMTLLIQVENLISSYMPMTQR